MALFIVDRVGTGFSVRPGENTLQAAASALKAEAWAEGTLPGGAGTKSAKEWVGEISNSVSEISMLSRKLTGTINATANIFDKNDPDVAPGYLVLTASGNLSASATYNTTGFVPVNPSTDHYAKTATAFFAWFDANKNYISATGRSGNVYTSPSNAAFLRYAIPTTDTLDAFYITEGSSPLAAYVPYGGEIDTSVLRGIGELALADEAVTPRKTSFVFPGKNLWDASAVTVGQRIAASGAVTVDATYTLSDFIPVEGGETYICNKSIRFRTSYDAGFMVIPASGSNDNLAAAIPWVIPSGVSYVRLSINPLSNANGLQFEKGSVVTGYQEYGFDLDPRVRLAGSAAVTSAWVDRTIAFIGDSLTAQKAWITPIIGSLGSIEANYGIGGSRLSGDYADSMWQDTRINAIPTDVDALILLGGTNDWANNVAVGSIGDSDPTLSVYGALNTIATKIKARFPLVPIFWATVPYSEMTLPRAGFTTPSTNSHGTIDAYNAAVRAVAQREGFAIIDFYREAGFHNQNITSYMSNDGNRIHPNTAGGGRMAAVGVGRLNSLAPLE